MAHQVQRDQYGVTFANVIYSVRFMLGRPGYWGEWQCPICDQMGRSEPKAIESVAREAVLLAVGNHHLEKHLGH